MAATVENLVDSLADRRLLEAFSRLTPAGRDLVARFAYYTAEERPPAVDDAEGLTRPLYDAYRAWAPRDSTGRPRVDGDVALSGLAFLAGEFLASVPQDKREGAVAMLTSMIGEQAGRRARAGGLAVEAAKDPGPVSRPT